MKNLFLNLILVLLFTVGNVKAKDVIQGNSVTPDPATHAELNRLFNKYELAILDLNRLNLIVSNEETARILLQIGQNKWDLTLFKNELRSPDYTSIFTIGDNKIAQERKACITYAGYSDDNLNSSVRLTVSDEIFKGYI